MDSILPPPSPPSHISLPLTTSSPSSFLTPPPYSYPPSLPSPNPTPPHRNKDGSKECLLISDYAGCQRQPAMSWGYCQQSHSYYEWLISHTHTHTRQGMREHIHVRMTTYGVRLFMHNGRMSLEGLRSHQMNSQNSLDVIVIIHACYTVSVPCLLLLHAIPSHREQGNSEEVGDPGNSEEVGTVRR